MICYLQFDKDMAIICQKISPAVVSQSFLNLTEHRTRYLLRKYLTGVSQAKMHSMSFHGDVAETILFRSWRINDTQGMIGSIIGIILLTMLYEGLKCYREYLFARTTFLRKRQQKKSRNALLFSRVHFFQTLLHVIQVVLGYFLMFIFMSYNYWLCIAIGAGTALGYWLFASEKSNNDNTDCCS